MNGISVAINVKQTRNSKGSSMRTEADNFFEVFDNEPKLEYLEITVGRLCNLHAIVAVLSLVILGIKMH